MNYLDHVVLLYENSSKLVMPKFNKRYSEAPALTYDNLIDNFMTQSKGTVVM